DHGKRAPGVVEHDDLRSAARQLQAVPPRARAHLHDPAPFHRKRIELALDPVLVGVDVVDFLALRPVALPVLRSRLSHAQLPLSRLPSFTGRVSSGRSSAAIGSSTPLTNGAAPSSP